MTDSIVDDVQVLLDKELGDQRILGQIQRAAENNEVISNFERNYVNKLVEKYLRPKPPVENKISELPKQIVQDVEIPSSLKPQTTQIWSQAPKITKSTSKNNLIMLGIGIAVLAIIIIVAVSLSGISDDTSNNTIPNQTSRSFSINTDSTSYNKGDIISINGKSNFSFGNQVNLSIENSDGELVWSEQISVKNDGQFNTLTFAGGFGWEKTGTFMVTAQSNSETASYSFSFNE